MTFILCTLRTPWPRAGLGSFALRSSSIISTQRNFCLSSIRRNTNNAATTTDSSVPPTEQPVDEAAAAAAAPEAERSDAQANINHQTESSQSEEAAVSASDTHVRKMKYNLVKAPRITAYLDRLRQGTTKLDVIRGIAAQGSIGNVLDIFFWTANSGNLSARVEMPGKGPKRLEKASLRRQNPLRINGVTPYVLSQKYVNLPADDTSQPAPEGASRVLLIRGPVLAEGVEPQSVEEPMLAKEALEEFFAKQGIDLENEWIGTRPDEDGSLVIEWRFVGWRKQAGPAMEALKTHYPQLRVEYGPDLCAAEVKKEERPREWGQRARLEDLKKTIKVW